MLKLRLQRIGRRNDPSFRLVATESTHGPRSGNFRELLGSYNPRQKTASLKSDRIKYWIEHGAQVSDTVHNLLIEHKVLSGKKVNVLPRKSPVVKKEDEQASEDTEKQKEAPEVKEEEVKEEPPSTEEAEKAPKTEDSEKKE